jgi:hypothetical protein
LKRNWAGILNPLGIALAADVFALRLEFSGGPGLFRLSQGAKGKYARALLLTLPSIIFLTYRTHALAVEKKNPDQKVVDSPEGVGTGYGLTVMNCTPPAEKR